MILSRCHTNTYLFSVSDLMELNEAEKFLKYIPAGSETGICLVGEADFVDHPVSAFVRLSQAREMGLQVFIPIQNIFPQNYLNRSK